MIRQTFLFITILLSINLNAQESIQDILSNADCPMFEVVGEPKLYAGDDLFSLINGGAELYHEYGFVEVLAAEMSVSNTDAVKVEVYDMGSSDAAWGIFSMTATSRARALDLGDQARMGDGFLQYIKGPYMLYSYYNQLGEDDVLLAASCIADNIQTSSQAPKLMQLIQADGREADKLLYFHGNLGLSSVYNFHYKDVFGYTEGAAAIYSDLKVILLTYPDQGGCIDHYKDAKEFFISSTKYHDQLTLRGSFHMKDRKEQQIDCYIENNYLIIFISDGTEDLNNIREDIADAMRE
jgi:hypothetical protein